MKRLLKKIISPYEIIKELEQEIESQDKQFETQQHKLSEANRKIKILTGENERFDRTNKRSLETIRSLRKRIKELENK